MSLFPARMFSGPVVYTCASSTLSNTMSLHTTCNQYVWSNNRNGETLLQVEVITGGDKGIPAPPNPS